MTTTAVIPIRTGSQRVKDKNLRPFGDTTLLELKIRNLIRVPEIDRIIINTNSEAAINIVKNLNSERISYQRREEYYASSQCSGSEFFQHLGEVTNTDIFVYTPCTSPFISPKTISKCIQKYHCSLNCDCIATVSLVKEFLWLEGNPINYDPKNAPNSQDLPNVTALNFGVTVTSRKDLIENRNIIGKRPQFVITSDIEAIDIDTPLDFYVAEQIYYRLQRNGGELQI